MQLQRGANVAISADAVTVQVDCPPPPGGEIDVSAYLLGEDGKVRGDHDMVFFNQTKGADGAVGAESGRRHVELRGSNSAGCRRTIARIVFCVTVDKASQSRRRLAARGSR